MSCPTCSHTLATLHNGTAVVIRQCERCGTTVVNRGTHTDTYVPKLVERCRQYEDTVVFEPPSPWQTFGIAESINLPDDRPK